MFAHASISSLAAHLPIEMMNINVDEDSEEPRQDFLAERLERAWETVNISIYY